MSKYLHKLVLNFDNDQDDLLYEGPSFYRTNIIDSLRITSKGITLSVLRGKKYSKDELIFSPASPTRYQFFRALSYYFAVVGTIANPSECYIETESEKIPCEIGEVIEVLPTESLDLLLDPVSAAKCFSKGGLTVYIMITYFIKAQIDKVSNDCFRAAWSGLNAFYNTLVSPNAQERIKLEELANLINQHELKNTMGYFDSLDPLFWDRVRYYPYVEQLKSRQKDDLAKKQIFDQEKHTDRLLFEKLGGTYVDILKSELSKIPKTDEFKKERERYDKMIRNFTEKVNGKRKKLSENPKDRVRFLICDYCYFTRNRNYHGLLPYPLFTMVPKDDVQIEKILTQVLLRMIKDMMEEV